VNGSSRILLFREGVLKVSFPFHGKKVLLLLVALLANRGYVSLACLTTPDNGNDMVHTQLSRRKKAAAITASAPVQTLLPPAGLAQDPGLFPLSFNFFPAYLDHEGVGHFLRNFPFPPAKNTLNIFLRS
jgi:hypothetical protein